MSLMDFVVSPPGCGLSVIVFWGWDSHEAQLRCSDEVDGDNLNMKYQEGP
jgi:subtilase family serine protease